MTKAPKKTTTPKTKKVARPAPKFVTPKPAKKSAAKKAPKSAGRILGDIILPATRAPKAPKPNKGAPDVPFQSIDKYPSKELPQPGPGARVGPKPAKDRSEAARKAWETRAANGWTSKTGKAPKEKPAPVRRANLDQLAQG